MIQSKKQMYIVICAFILTLLLGSTTYAFFNYTRTGASNTIRVGRINFSSNQNNSLNITNLFPMTSSEADNANLDTLTITIDGDTTYTDGEEFLVSIVDVNNTINNKKIPVNYIASYTPQDNKSIGTSNNKYFSQRKNSDMYLLSSEGIVSENERILVSHINNGDSGVHGILTIKTYIDKDRIAISDTHPNEEIISINENKSQNDINNCVNYITQVGYDQYLLNGETIESFCNGTGTLYGENMEYWIEDDWFDDSDLNNLINLKILNYINNGTTTDWVGNRTVFTTEEWNSLTTNSISFKIKVEANEGIWVEDVINTMGYLSYPRDSGVKEIHFIRESLLRMQSRYDNASGVKSDLTINNEGKVLAWREEDILYIASPGTTYLTNGSGLFGGFSEVENIVFENVDTSRINSLDSMFSGCTKLKNINLDDMNLSSIVSTGKMFSGCNSLTNIDLSHTNLKNLINMSDMFIDCTSLEIVNISGLGGDNLSNISGIFNNCTSLQKINMSNFNFGTINNISFLFASASNSLEKLSLKNANTIGLTSLSFAFDGLSALEELDLTNINTSNVTTMQATFRNCHSLTSLDLSSFNTLNIATVLGAFRYDENLTTIYVSDSWDLSHLANISGDKEMFSGCTSLVGGNNTHYDYRHVDYEYAIIDGTDGKDGYLTLKTN